MNPDPWMRGFVLLFCAVFIHCGGGGDCAYPNPNYDASDPESVICFDETMMQEPSGGEGPRMENAGDEGSGTVGGEGETEQHEQTTTESPGGAKAGTVCETGAECASAICQEGFCALPTHCTDGSITGDESAVDCGGSCVYLCPNGLTCNGPSDCESGCCNGIGICDADSDGDGVCDLEDQCTAQFKEPDCDACASPNFAWPGCMECAPQFEGQGCVQCNSKTGWTGPDCAVCGAGWYGTHCNQKATEDCLALLTCMQTCADLNDAACIDSCKAMGSPEARDLFEAWEDCVTENCAEDPSEACLFSKCLEESEACLGVNG